MDGKIFTLSPASSWCWIVLLAFAVFGIGLNPITVALCASANDTPGIGNASTANHGVASGKRSVEIRWEQGRYRLYRDGQPYFIRGVGGHKRLELAADAGANSLRTWGSKNSGKILDRAQKHGMSVLLGIWLSHSPSDYFNENYKAGQIAKVRDLVGKFKNHPALLMWSLGNEINLKRADIPEAWQFVNELARLIKAQDPDHPVITVVAYRQSTLNNIAAHAPDLDAVGINAYGSLPGVRAMIDSSIFSGPYLITEWGVNGHWEAKLTEWGRPIEAPSAVKAERYRQRYGRDIVANSDRCLGSYVFLWGQKQERTPTWYSMFVEDIPGVDMEPKASPAVDVMVYNWSGFWPSNKAPEVHGVKVNGATADGNVTVAAGEPITAEVVARDPENDRLEYVWELLEEPTVLNSGGAREPRPRQVGNVENGFDRMIRLTAPAAKGAYRLFIYVFDGHGHVGTANLPFRVTS